MTWDFSRYWLNCCHYSAYSAGSATCMGPMSIDMTPVQVYSSLMSIRMTPRRVRSGPMSIRMTSRRVRSGPMPVRMTPMRIPAGPMSIRSTPMRIGMALRSIDATLLHTRMGRLQARITPGSIDMGPMQAAPRPAPSLPRSGARLPHAARAGPWADRPPDATDRSEDTFYRWKRSGGGLGRSERQRLRSTTLGRAQGRARAGGGLARLLQYEVGTAGFVAEQSEHRRRRAQLHPRPPEPHSVSATSSEFG